MTLDEAITHAKAVYKSLKEECPECAKQHPQMRELAQMILTILHDRIPVVFDVFMGDRK